MTDYTVRDKGNTVRFNSSTLEKQIFIGPFVGPFLALLTMAVALFYYSPEQMELPLAGLAGIYFSWKWRIRGIAIAWVLLTAVVSIKIVSSVTPSMWWNLTLATSLALASLITGLTQHQIRNHLEWKYQDTVEQQGRLAIVEGRLNTILQTVQQERTEAQNLIDSLKNDLKASLEDAESEKNVQNSLKNDFEQIERAFKELDVESKSTTEQLAKLQNEYKAAQAVISNFEKRESKFEEQESELKELRHTLNAYQHQIVSYKEDLQQGRQQQTLIEEMSELIETLTREKTLLESSLGTLQKEREDHRANEENRVNEESTDVVVTDKSPGELRRLQGFHLQLKEQFAEKSKILDETRRELFLVQEQLNVALLEIKEKDLTSAQITLDEHIEHLTKAESAWKRDVEETNEEIQRLYAIIESTNLR